MTNWWSNRCINPRADPCDTFLRRPVQMQGICPMQGLSKENHTRLQQMRKLSLCALHLWNRCPQSMVLWRVAWVSSGNLDMQILRPISDLLNENLNFNKIPQVITGTLQSEKAGVVKRKQPLDQTYLNWIPHSVSLQIFNKWPNYSIFPFPHLQNYITLHLGSLILLSNIYFVPNMFHAIY